MAGCQAMIVESVRAVSLRPLKTRICLIQIQ